MVANFFSSALSTGKGIKSFGTNLGKGGLGSIKNMVWK